MTSQFRDTFYTLAPPWLRTGVGEKFLYTLALCRDLLLEKTVQAVSIRFPGQGDVSQLPFLAYDRQLQQGPAESNAAFTARLKGAFKAWGIAGSRVSTLEQLQAYLIGTYPDPTSPLPQAGIVGGSYPTVNTWDVLDVNTPSIALEGGLPARTLVMPGNFNWDGKPDPWRSWLVLYMSAVPTGQSGAAAQSSAADPSACFKDPGHNVGGVWVPQTSGTPVNSPWQHITHLAGLTGDEVGKWLDTSGGAPGNNGRFPIVEVVSASECIIANPNNTAVDAGPIAWSIVEYPYIGPGPVWGAPGFVFGQGQLSTPPLDTGSNVGGVWKPTALGDTSAIAWGLNVPAAVLQSIRQIVGGPGRGWKSAGTWYVEIVIAFDGGDGTAGKAYSPLSAPGAGNPDGTFGSRGKLVGGVWVPTRRISSAFDAYCQGTGSWAACSVQNIT